LHHLQYAILHRGVTSLALSIPMYLHRFKNNTQIDLWEAKLKKFFMTYEKKMRVQSRQRNWCQIVSECTHVANRPMSGNRDCSLFRGVGTDETFVGWKKFSQCSKICQYNIKVRKDGYSIYKGLVPIPACLVIANMVDMEEVQKCISASEHCLLRNNCKIYLKLPFENRSPANKLYAEGWPENEGRFNAFLALLGSLLGIVDVEGKYVGRLPRLLLLNHDSTGFFKSCSFC